MKSLHNIFGTLLLFFLWQGVNAQEISPMLVGNNIWYPPFSQEVWDLTEACQLGTIRIGGHHYDDYFPEQAEFLDWVSRIQAMGAEAIIQVSQYRTPEQAADLVRYFNIDSASGEPVKYWNIGNEPWLQNGRPDVSTVGAMVEAYFKPIAVAMKEVDSTIKIFGPDFCYFIEPAIADLFGGANDIAGKIPGKTYYYCDGISWHKYPQDDNINLAYAGLSGFQYDIIKCKEKVDEVNALYSRTGEYALQWSIGEFNAKSGDLVHSWENGHMFAGILGLCMKYEATYASTWSIFESNGNMGSTDFSFIDGDLIPRATYRHMEMVAKNFKGSYLDGESSNVNLIVFGSKQADTISVMILNRKAGTPFAYTLHLNADSASGNPVQLNVNGESAQSYSDLIAGRSTQLLLFKGGELVKTLYTHIDFENGTPPVTTLIYNAGLAPSPPTGLVTTALSYSSIQVDWELAPGDTLTGYQIERKKEGDADFQLISVTGHTVDTYLDDNLQDTTAYTYRIVAYNSAGNSVPSEESTAITYQIPPSLLEAGMNTKKLYYSAADRALHVEFNDPDRVCNLNLFTLDGRSVLSERVEATGEARIDVSGVPKGVYVVSIGSDQAQYSQKVFIY